MTAMGITSMISIQTVTYARQSENTQCLLMLWGRKVHAVGMIGFGMTKDPMSIIEITHLLLIRRCVHRVGCMIHPLLFTSKSPVGGATYNQVRGQVTYTSHDSGNVSRSTQSPRGIINNKNGSFYGCTVIGKPSKQSGWYNVVDKHSTCHSTSSLSWLYQLADASFHCEAGIIKQTMCSL